MRTNERANVTKRPIFFYPGRSNTYDIKAVPMDDTLITGCIATGKTTIVNNIIIQLIQQCSPSEVRIHVIDGYGFESVDWNVQKRGLPHIVYTGQTARATVKNYVPDVCEYIKSIGEEHARMVQAGLSVEGIDVIILDDVKICEEQKSQFKDALRLSDSVKVILATQPKDWLDEDFIGLFKNRICLKSTARVSELMLGCNIASENLLKDNCVCYYNRVNSDVVYQKLWIPHTSELVLSKIIDAFSVMY